MFPNLDYNKIMEISFKLKMFTHIDYDKKNYREFLWDYQRLMKMTTEKETGLTQLLGM